MSTAQGRPQAGAAAGASGLARNGGSLVGAEGGCRAPAEAALGPPAELLPMTPEWIERVVAVEQTAYSHPWSRRHFEDTLAAGYHARLLVGGETLMGYYVAMKGVDEVHLLNLTVAPAHQGQGWGRLLLEAMDTWARSVGAQTAWLEVRVSNEPALRLYERHGYRRVGLRRAYYPAARGMREDAVVMCCSLEEPPGCRR
jgi:ribosomal-protein-alanine N-acetyltransferase